MMTLLTTNPYTIENIPPEDELYQEGLNLIKASQTKWKKGKKYVNDTVDSTFCPKDPGQSNAWFARHSTHSKEDGTFDEFWSLLGEDKPEHEMGYVPDLKRIKLMKRISDAQSIWNLYYVLRAPLSPRVFTILQVIRLSGEPGSREGLIISLPIDLSNHPELSGEDDKNNVMARYTAVELLQEKPDGGSHWSMAVSSNNGGWVPTFISDAVMPSEIAKDVPWFLAYMKAKRSDTK